MRSAIVRRASGNDGEGIDEVDSPTDGFNDGTLAIRTNTQDIWQRPVRRPLPEDGNTILRFEVPYARIMPPDGENANYKKFVVYDISIRQDSTTVDPNPTTIERRYTDFLKLFEGLRKEQPALIQNVTFPKKVLVGNFTTDLIAERSASFEVFLDYIVSSPLLRDSTYFLEFLQRQELARSGQLLDERRNEQAVPILENCFRLLNKIYLDRSKGVLLLLCRLVAACTTCPLPHPLADKYAELALRRYESVCDADLLVLYIPLLQSCVHLWWQRGRDNKIIQERLDNMGKRGIKIKGGPTLTQAIHALDPRTETN